MRTIRKTRAPYMTTAKHNGWTCAETGQKIKKGDPIAYYPETQNAYCESSKTADGVRALEFSRAFCMDDANY